MSEENKPQVGDVWKTEDGEKIKVLFTADTKAFVKNIDNAKAFLFHSTGNFYDPLSAGCYKEKELSWIGEKLEIDWQVIK